MDGWKMALNKTVSMDVREDRVFPGAVFCVLLSSESSDPVFLDCGTDEAPHGFDFQRFLEFLYSNSDNQNCPQCRQPGLVDGLQLSVAVGAIEELLENSVIQKFVGQFSNSFSKALGNRIQEFSRKWEATFSDGSYYSGFESDWNVRGSEVDFKSYYTERTVHLLFQDYFSRDLLGPIQKVVSRVDLQGLNYSSRQSALVSRGLVFRVRQLLEEVFQKDFQVQIESGIKLNIQARVDQLFSEG